LVVNDDGPESLALRILVETLKDRFDVRISVPSRQRSGTGHGFSFLAPLGVVSTRLWDVDTFLVDGFPADAVKFAVCQEGYRPDIVLAGINPGENAGVCAPYSGTVACAREAALFGIPAVALSSMGMDDAHFHAIARWTVRLLESGLPTTPQGVFWNVNFPLVHPRKWGDTKICAGATAMFRDRYLPKGPGLWQLEGTKDHSAIAEGSDDHWLAKGHPAMVPQVADATCHELLARLDWVPPTGAFETGEP
jgi:5'-nucleotidase